MEVSKIVSQYEALTHDMNTLKKTRARCKSLSDKMLTKEKRHKNITDIKRPKSHFKQLEAEKCETPPRNRGSDKSDNVGRVTNNVNCVPPKRIPLNPDKTCEDNGQIEEQIQKFSATLKKRRSIAKLSNSRENLAELNSLNSEMDQVVPYPEEDNSVMFELNDFDDESEENFVVESYNPVVCGIEGQEYVIVGLSINRRSVSSGIQDEELQCMEQDSEFTFIKSENIPDGIRAYNHDSEDSFSFLDNFSYSPAESDNVFEDSSQRLQQSFNKTDLHRTISSNGDPKSKEEPKQTENGLNDKNVVEFKKEKVNYVIEELIHTEEQYITGLDKVLDLYKPYIVENIPSHLIGRDAYIFGNLEDILRNSKQFLSLIKTKSDDPDGIAQMFIDSEFAFDLYPLYSKNKPTADMCIREFDRIIKERQEQLRDKLGLASYLLTPIQRLGKYLLLLRQIKKEFQKKNLPLDTIECAINVIKNVMRRGNDFIAVDSIKEAEIDIASKGSFKMRALFNIHKPKKLTSMVFLFENIIVFTENVTKNIEQFKYFDSIPLSELSLGICEDKQTIFHLTNYTRAKKFPATATYILEAESPKIKSEWTTILGAKLWSQLNKAKEQQKQNNCVTEPQHVKKYSTGSLDKSSKKSTKIYRQSSDKVRSRFYD